MDKVCPFPKIPQALHYLEFSPIIKICQPPVDNMYPTDTCIKMKYWTYIQRIIL